MNTIINAVNQTPRTDSIEPSRSSMATRYPDQPIDFSLFYFASQEGGENDRGKYRLILESAEWADRNGFSAVWTPERHFHAFGGLSPNPSVLGGTLAAVTKNIQIRSGSVVLPLHNPIRVAEEWSVVDNVSDGRVGLGVACGWVPNDFVLSPDPESFDNRKEVFIEKLNTLRGLWRGDRLRYRNPVGKDIEIRTIPRPIQKELPVWITAAANPETFQQAGEMGVNLLTHLLGQGLKELEKKVKIYREAWNAAGHPGRGTLSLMLHTFVGACDDEVHDLVREPMKRYLGSSFGLAKGNLASVPFLKNTEGVDPAALTPEVIDQLLEGSFERYYQTSGLFGTPERCVDMIDRLKEIGVDEVACLIDYGLDTDTVLSGLESLNQVRLLANSQAKNRRERNGAEEEISVEDPGSPASEILATLQGEIQSPRTNTGDLGLQPATSSRAGVSSPIRASELEETISNIWCEVLRLDSVCKEENFFDLGGQSIQAVQVQAKLQNALGRKIPITDLYRFSTVKSLVIHLGQSGTPERNTTTSTARRRADVLRRRGRIQ